MFIQISPSSLAILGYRPEEMIGRSGIGFVHTDDADIARTEMRRARRERVTRVFECRYVHKDGHPVTLQWIGVWSEPERRHFYIGRDMTERKQAEEALLESEEVARGIIDTALDAFVQMDEAGTITEWNRQAEAMFGWSRAEAIGRPLATTIVPRAHRARHVAGLERFLYTGEAAILGKRFEIEAVGRDGGEFRVEIAVTALRRLRGYVFSAFIRDLTDKIAADAQLRQSQKMDAVGQLTGGVAHDFNNTLTVITGTIEILAEGVEDRPQLAAIARMIDEAATRGAELTHQLLAFARRQPLEPRPIDPNALARDTANLLRPTLGEQIEIEAMLEDNVWRAVADPAQLTTALLNLAVNARDAMPNGGKLTLETGNVILDETYAQSNAEVRAGPYVMIAVSDTGSGMTPDVLEKVFEPFFTTKDVGKGTGLGLSMVYGFVKQSGGHIKVYSEIGHGTTIKLYLPRAETTELAAAKPAGAPAMPGGNETILVVEDDRMVRDYVEAQLTSLGYSTLAAANAAEALEHVKLGAQFDLLFTDVIMPGGMNGRELAEEVTQLRPGTRVLFTSGYTEDAIVHHGRLDPGVALLNQVSQEGFGREAAAGDRRRRLVGAGNQPRAVFCIVENSTLQKSVNGRAAAAGRMIGLLQPRPCRLRQSNGGDVMSQTRREMFATAGAAAALASVAPPAFGAWEPSERYPDPYVQVLDPAFNKYRLGLASVEKIAGGCRWNEGPVWFGDARCLLWSDIPNNRIMRWDEETGRVGIYRKPSNNANGNTRDRQGRLVTCEHDARRVTRTEYDGTITVLIDKFDGKPLNSPNDVVVKSDDLSGSLIRHSASSATTRATRRRPNCRPTSIASIRAPDRRRP